MCHGAGTGRVENKLTSVSAASARADDTISNTVTTPTNNERICLLEQIRIYDAMNRSDHWMCSNNVATVIGESYTVSDVRLSSGEETMSRIHVPFMFVTLTVTPDGADCRWSGCQPLEVGASANAR